MTLRDYQEDAVDKALPIMRDGGGFGLWLEQRTGKTRTSLAITLEVLPDYLWVICPKVGGAAPEVWWAEIGEWVKAHPEVRHIKIEVHNYEQWVSQREKWYKLAKKIGNRLLVICDESHYIKTRGARRSQVVRRLGKYARWRLALTGTPIAQGIQDAWAQFDFIDPDIFGKFDNTYKDPKTRKILLEEGFDGRYLVWGGYNKREIVGFANEDEFYEKFHNNSYRITLREARKTPLMIKYTRVPIELQPVTEKIYNELWNDLVAEVNKKRVKIKNVLAKLIKCQQVTGGSVLIPEEDEDGNFLKPVLEDISNEKLLHLQRIVQKLPVDDKFIVVARFVHELDRIEKTLQKMGYSVAVVRGGSPYDRRFKQDCIALQIQSGMAVDMSKANHIIFYSMDFSLLNFEQARFRILDFHKPAGHYYFLNAIGTVDEDIYTAVIRKRNVAKMICDTYRGKKRAKHTAIPTGLEKRRA